MSLVAFWLAVGLVVVTLIGVIHDHPALVFAVAAILVLLWPRFPGPPAVKP